MFEHSEGDVEQLAHDGADDAHLGFTSAAQTGSEVA
jgi:hypothetical protein